MTEPSDDETLLTPAEVVGLQHQIEAGLLARAARESGRGWADATDLELRLLEDQGERARQRFIRANLRLVWMVARQFARRGRLPEADLFQEGCLGLITAVARYDHSRGFRFSTYALFWIRAYVGGAAARQLGAMNLPTSRAEQLRSARGVEVALAQRLGRAPTVGEVADALGREADWTAGLLAHQAPASLDGLDVADRDRLAAVGEARLARCPSRRRSARCSGGWTTSAAGCSSCGWGSRPVSRSATPTPPGRSASPSTGSAGPRRGPWRRCAASARSRRRRT